MSHPHLWIAACADPLGRDDLTEKERAFVAWAIPAWERGLWCTTQAARATACSRRCGRRIMKSLARKGVLKRWR